MKRYFQFDKHQTNLRQESLAGLTTFFSDGLHFVC